MHSKMYVQTYTGLHLCCLNPEQHKQTCGYWYTVTAHGSLPHTAFARRESLMQWLTERGLSLTEELPPHCSHGAQRITGTYRVAAHLSYDEFFAIKGTRTRVLSNGDYTLGIITEDSDGIRTVHHLNPNCNDRPKFDYTESRATHG